MEHASVQRSSSSRSDADDPTGGSIFVDEPKLSPGVQIPSASKKACLSLSNEPPITSEPVIIVVGEEEEKFFVRAHLLGASSEYFRETLSSSNDAPTLQTVKLPDADANAFRLFAKWLYTGRFHLLTGPDKHVRDNPREMHWDEISACYALFATLQASAFSDATIDAFIRRMEIHDDTPIKLAKWIYPRTAKGSAHRSLCRDIVLHTWDRKTTWKSFSRTSSQT